MMILNELQNAALARTVITKTGEDPRMTADEGTEKAMTSRQKNGYLMLQHQLGSRCPHQLRPRLVLWRVMALVAANRNLGRPEIEIGKHHLPVLGAYGLVLVKRVYHSQIRRLRRRSIKMTRTEIVGSEQRLTARRTQRTPQSLLKSTQAYSLPNDPKSIATAMELQEMAPVRARSHERRCHLLKKVERIQRTENALGHLTISDL